MAPGLVVTWRDGSEVTLPTRAGMSTGEAGPIHEGDVVVRCQIGHEIGVVSRSDPPAVFRGVEPEPSFILLDGALQGVTVSFGMATILGGDQAEIQLRCRPCGWAVQALTAEQVATIDRWTTTLFCRRITA